ncbi:hypothetical protein FJD32_009435 [Shewanella sp. LC6]|uniref:hypothetical protein n=1 Tax=unclassified Shewanella TaxID=196818 RepID=UPI00112B7182|nr:MULTISPECIES: hypothetical protein [unclassified Shewanella]QQK59707.1 hypothetical protein FJD32_009435 [Shewanella sp. LC6]TPE56674.1 hypothetical protein FJD33_14025 [Shewanella sp. LC2]
MSKVVVIFNGAIVSVLAVESDIGNGQKELVPLVPADWVDVTALNAAYPTFQGKTKPPVIKQSKQDDLIEHLQALTLAMTAQTAAITAQTTAISQLVNSNLDIVDQMMATEDNQEDDSPIYLDGSGEL